ncbi:MAG: PD-(D/E)XK nuclease family protein, partial [Verrucomicrobia bacterium]|nr:PD-(D/E)XK nuclease family protein [Verrucomicrobiota bacterium]
MDSTEFLRFVSQAEWRFAKSVPNWPHFYIVEQDLPNQADFQAAKVFIRESGYGGKFYDMDVVYLNADGWTYWASPLAKPSESQYMLNRCKTECTYESLAKSGGLPSEGFRESELSLSPILGDAEFRSLVRDAVGGEFTVFNVLGTADYEIRHSNVLSWLLDRGGSHRQESAFLELLWQIIKAENSLPNLSFRDYSVTREGANENERFDIFIKAKNLDWVIVIENKLFSPERDNQLNDYFKDIEGSYAKVPNRLYFYLTPEGDAPAKEEDSQNWIAISYWAVGRAVKKFVDRDLPDRVKGFLE